MAIEVLLIEDDSTLAELLGSALSEAGFAVRTAPDGAEGLRVFTERPSEVVVTDILMPRMEGYETIIELKAMNPGVRILAISGGGVTGRGEDILRHASMFGAHAVMKKPISLEDFVSKVRDLAARDACIG